MTSFPWTGDEKAAIGEAEYAVSAERVTAAHALAAKHPELIGTYDYTDMGGERVFIDADDMAQYGAAILDGQNADAHYQCWCDHSDALHLDELDADEAAT